MNMIKRGLFVFLTFILALSLTSYVSASIGIGQPEKLYNAGDSFSTKFNISSSSAKSDFLSQKIVCGNGEVEIFKNPYSIKAGEMKSGEISFDFDKFLIDDLLGNCYLSIEFGGEKTNSQDFKLSREINVSAELNKTLFNPLEKVLINGIGIKENGKYPSGNASLDISAMGIYLSKTLNAGKFSFEFEIPEDAKAIEYSGEIRIDEKDEYGNIINSGNYPISIKVNQIAKSLDVAVSGKNIQPGEDFSFTPIIEDQAGDVFNGQTKAGLYSPSGKIYYETNAESNKASTYNFNSSSSAGNWVLKVIYGELSTEKSIEIIAKENISFNLVNETLYISNLGNMNYDKEISVKIGEVQQNLRVALDIGQSKTYKLYAKNGVYEISLVEENKNYALGEAYLTGNAVKIKEGSQFFRLNNSYLWVLLIILLISAGVYYYRKGIKREYVGKHSSFLPQPKFTKLDMDKVKIQNESVKRDCTVVALKIKNAAHLRNSANNALETIDKALSEGNSINGKIKIDGDYQIIMFAQPKSGLDKSVDAVKAAIKIQNVLKEYNLNYSGKIDFGIGINYGNLIIENKEGKLNFISTDNTISLAKRIAQEANESILLSDKIRTKIISGIKSEREGEFWKISRVVNRSQHSDFINNFKKKQERS